MRLAVFGAADGSGTVSSMEVAERIRRHGSSLTAAERRVAEAVLAAPQAVGFGTVAELARAADVGAASVVRMATKLGFDGYTDLQQCIQDDLTQQLRPAAERIRETRGDGADDGDLEITNVRATIESADAIDRAAAIERIADTARPLVIVSGEASMGVAHQFAAQLHQLRDGVRVLQGSDVVVRRELALVPSEATAIVIDLRRYERWVLDAHEALHRRGVWSVGLTDSMLSPIAARSDVTFLISAASSGPFDSHVGTLSLLNLLASGAAAALRSSAAERLATIESAWSEQDTLTEADDS